MTMPAWPSILPRPQIDGYALSRADLDARRSLAVGPNLARRRSTRQAAAIAQTTITCTDMQMAIFEAWWFSTLSGGVAWFSLTLPTDGGLAAQTTVSARCTDGYKADMVEAGIWRVSLPLQIDSTGGP